MKAKCGNNQTLKMITFKLEQDKQMLISPIFAQHNIFGQDRWSSVGVVVVVVVGYKKLVSAKCWFLVCPPPSPTPSNKTYLVHSLISPSQFGGFGGFTGFLKIRNDISSTYIMHMVQQEFTLVALKIN